MSSSESEVEEHTVPVPTVEEAEEKKPPPPAPVKKPKPLSRKDLADRKETQNKSLEYARLFRKKQKHPEVDWKFNKARQNWLVRHVWDSSSVPDKDFKAVKKYLKTMRGASREEFVQQCQTTLAAEEEGSSRSTRAKKLLKSLKKSSPS